MYRELDDNEILYMIEENNENYDYLIEKYKPLLLKVCQDYLNDAKKLGFEMDDLLQISYLGLLDAVKSYKDNKRTSFYTYMIRCVRNRLCNEVRNQTTNKKLSLNTAISYESRVPGTNKSLIEILPDKNSPNPIEFLLEELMEIEYKKIINSLPLEVALVYEMKIDGFDNNQISTFTGVSKKDIPRYFKSAKKKFQKKKFCFN